MIFGNHSNHKGFTFVELVIVIVTLSTLAGLTIAGSVYLIQSGIFIPKELDVYMLGADMLDIMVEGDQSATGLRFARRITEAKDGKVIFMDPDETLIQLEWDSGTNRMKRKIGSGPNQNIPYYIGGEIDVIKAGTIKIFKYYDANGSLLSTPVANPTLIKYLEINTRITTGSGVFDEWEGSCDLSTAVYIKKY